MSLKTKCYSVRLESLVRISDKCFKAICFDGSEDLIPSSQVFAQDYDVIKSNAYWISAWILDKKNLQFSTKKEAWFWNDTKKMCPTITFEKHTPKRIKKSKTQIDESLIR